MEDTIVNTRIQRVDEALHKHPKADAAFDSDFEKLDDDMTLEKEYSYCTDIELDGSSFCWSDEESASIQWLSRKSSFTALTSNLFSTEFYSVLSSSHIRRKQVDMISSVAESLAIAFDDAESLLCYCQYVQTPLSRSIHSIHSFIYCVVDEDGNRTVSKSSISQVPSRSAPKPASFLQARRKQMLLSMRMFVALPSAARSAVRIPFKWLVDTRSATIAGAASLFPSLRTVAPAYTPSVQDSGITSAA